MSSSPEALQEARPFFACDWIISRRDDLIYFSGSAFAGYLLLGLNRLGGIPLIYLTFIWAIVFDGPHVWGTFSRTYLDAQERAERARLLYGSAVWFVVGPVLVLMTQWLHQGFFAKAFFFAANIWAYYHLVKQHYGFMILYKRKNRDLAPMDNALDRLFLVFLLGYPFLSMLINYPAAHDYLPVTFPSGVESAIDRILFMGMVAVIILWAGRQIQRAVGQEALNLPKYLLMLGCIPLHWIVILAVMRWNLSPIALVPLLTLPHNIQYHRLVWFHNSNKYSSAGAASRYGIAVFANETFLRYVIFGLLFDLIYQLPRSMIGVVSDNMSSQAIVAAFFWGFAFTHYYLDAKIWRVRRDVALNNALRLSEAGSQ